MPRKKHVSRARALDLLQAYQLLGLATTVANISDVEWDCWQRSTEARTAAALDTVNTGDWPTDVTPPTRR